METDPRGIIQDTLTELRERIAANIRDKGLNASGRTIASMRVEVLPDPRGYRGILYGRNFFGALETGSRPWRNQYNRPPKFFVDIIADWMDNKGLAGSPYPIASKIMRKGSRTYRAGGRADIYSNEIEKTLETMGDRLLAFFEVAYTETIKLNR